MAEMSWPLRGAEAVGDGEVSMRELRRFYQPVYPGVYVPRGVELSAIQRARAAWLWSRRRGVVAGLSASALLGAKWINPGRSAELIHSNRRTPPMLTVHTDQLSPDETIEVDGMSVTTPARTAFDLGRRLGLKESVQRIDALMHATQLKVLEIESTIHAHQGVRGLSQLHRALALVDGGAESPYESLTRLMLVGAGLPAPQTQLPVLDEFGFVVAYVDMGWPEYRVAVEFDGAQHWSNASQRSRDIERLAELEALGWTIIRVSSDMLRTSAVVIRRVGAALEAAGCPRTW
jgi:REase_MTES_1575